MLAETQDAVMPLVPYLDTLRWVFIPRRSPASRPPSTRESTTGRPGGERAGRMAERLETTEKADAIHRWSWTPLPAGLVVATTGSAPARRAVLRGPMAVCPPVVKYSPELQAQAADELELLPESSAITEMLSEYAVLREQARACQSQ